MSNALRPRAWVTGAAGLIGSYVCEAAATYGAGFEVYPVTRQNINFADPESVRALWAKAAPEVVIHCAALARSPACEKNPELARQLNVEATRVLADLARNIPFVFVSTDLVFDGRKGRYVETDAPNPLSVYGETKAEAERVVLENPSHTVVRTSLNAGYSRAGDRSFMEETFTAWRQGRMLTLFTDEFRSPIATEYTARALWRLASLGAPGLYHLAGSERLSRWEIGELLASRRPDLKPQLRAASLREYAGPPRSPDTSLRCDKLQTRLDFELPRFSDWVRSGAGDAAPGWI